LHVSCPRGSGLVGKSNHLRVICLPSLEEETDGFVMCLEALIRRTMDASLGVDLMGSSLEE
jgi:hypothetical protein